MEKRLILMKMPHHTFAGKKKKKPHSDLKQ